ncbi:hypothetical protein B0H21DRAFT_391103 [Amylocystis lapponica]|nr:hypothetical protein B0H21DRAFT_391103 [Amylocystis lapponica]
MESGRVIVSQRGIVEHLAPKYGQCGLFGRYLASSTYHDSGSQWAAYVRSLAHTPVDTLFLTDQLQLLAGGLQYHKETERKRGTNTANPNKGKLAAQLEASKSPSKVPEPRQEEQLVHHKLMACIVNFCGGVQHIPDIHAIITLHVVVGLLSTISSVV